MVKGLETFKEYFKDHSNNYLLIGGTACDIQFNKAGLDFRATKDLDIILIVEAQTSDFVKHFWNFIKLGEYKSKQRSEGKRILYRFTDPKQSNFPEQIELFSRNPDLDLSSEVITIPISTENYLSNLSAILMKDDFYEFTIKNSEKVDGVNLASVPCLIGLKASAYLDLKQRKEAGEAIDNNNIKKHKNDIVRLATILSQERLIDVPQEVINILQLVIIDLQSDPPDVRAIFKTMGITQLRLDTLVNQIKQTFNL
jgi:SepF-like predicted cell division protein (DUF552 family)